MLTVFHTLGGHWLWNGLAEISHNIFVCVLSETGLNRRASATFKEWL